MNFKAASEAFLLVGEDMKQNKIIVNKSNRDAIEKAIKWVIRDKSVYATNKGLWISGDVGVGKTFIAEVLVRMLKYSGSSMFRTHALGLIDILNGEEKERLFSSPLFIDDLGAEEPIINYYGTKIRPIYEVLNRRYLDQRFNMIVTTNLSPSQIEERYGDRVRDRIKEMFNVIKITGQSLRG